MSGFARDADSRRMLVEAVVDGGSQRPLPTAADRPYAVVSRRPDVARMRGKADALGPGGGARLLGQLDVSSSCFIYTSAVLASLHLLLAYFVRPIDASIGYGL